MTNVTIPVDEDVLKKARMRALAQGTSVSAVVREFLEAYAGVRSGHEAALRELLALSGASDSGRGASRWTREDLHERRP